MTAHILVFSDIDGALLDEETFEWEAARDTLSRLRRAKIPVCFVSSKTRAEIETLRAEIGNSDPYSAENGAVVDYGYKPRKVIGRPLALLEQAFAQITKDSGARLEALDQMTTRRAETVTGLKGPELALALRRAHSVPFLLHEGATSDVEQAARRRGLRIHQGKRLLHLVGDHDKSDAVALMKNEFPDATTIGVGDGPNDVALLQNVDHPVYQGTHPPPELPGHTHVEPKTGPEGWSRAIERMTGDHASSPRRRQMA